MLRPFLKHTRQITFKEAVGKCTGIPWHWQERPEWRQLSEADTVGKDVGVDSGAGSKDGEGDGDRSRMSEDVQDRGKDIALLPPPCPAA
jgi:hypothetical protein